MLNTLLHDIVSELPIHSGRKVDLHKQIDATVNKTEEEENGAVNGASSTDGASSQ
jgi:hypothetical protein